MVKARGATVVVECPRPLARILASCDGIDAVNTEGESRPHFDVHIPLLSLPRIFGTSLENIPQRVPYLASPVDAVERWRSELSGAKGLKVGIAWQGSIGNVGDRQRSFPLLEFACIARMPQIQLYSLQFGAGREQLDSFEEAGSVIDLGDRLGDFSETAGIVSNLDLVITCDSSPAHLAARWPCPCGWPWHPRPIGAGWSIAKIVPGTLQCDCSAKSPWVIGPMSSAALNRLSPSTSPAEPRGTAWAALLELELDRKH